MTILLSLSNVRKIWSKYQRTLIVEVINQNNYYRLIHHSLCIIEQSSALTGAIFNLWRYYNRNKYSVSFELGKVSKLDNFITFRAPTNRYANISRGSWFKNSGISLKKRVVGRSHKVQISELKKRSNPNLNFQNRHLLLWQANLHMG